LLSDEQIQQMGLKAEEEKEEAMAAK